MQVEFSERQALAYELLENPAVVDTLFGGGAGGGKTLLVTAWAALQCRKYPGIRIGVGRKEISNLRKTTIYTLLHETHQLLNITKDDYKYHAIMDPRIIYKNGSEIIFIDLAYAPQDPDFDRLGSLNLTHAIIEELGEVMKKAKDVMFSRKGRWKNDVYNIVGKGIGTCNPSTNFLRQEYYDKYIKAGGGQFATWPLKNDNGEQIYVTLPNGKRIEAHQAFIKSLVTDNPFIPVNYIENLKSLPLAERKRLLEGNWDYYQDASTLFKRSNFIRANANPETDKVGYAGCDPSRGGDDCTFSYMLGNNLRDLTKIQIPSSVVDKGGYVAEKFIRWCLDRKVPASRAAVDIIGIGESVGDSCNRLGFTIQRFNAGSKQGVRTLDDTKDYGDARIDQEGRKGVPLFDNIKSQNYYDMAQAANTGEITFDPNLDHYDELCSQLEAHGYTTKERLIIVDKKDVVKTRLGKSPDLAEAFQAAYWVSKRKHYSAKEMFSI